MLARSRPPRRSPRIGFMPQKEPGDVAIARSTFGQGQQKSHLRQKDEKREVARQGWPCSLESSWEQENILYSR